jgi:tight adherence protein B
MIFSEEWLIFLIFFAAVFFFITAIHQAVTGGDDTIKRRLAQLKKESAGQSAPLPEWAKAIQKEEQKQRIDFKKLIGQVAGMSFVDKIEKKLAQSEVPMRASEWIILRVFLVVAPAVLALFVFNQPLIAAALTGAGFLLPGMYLGIKSKARMKKFNNQLAEFLTLVVNALRAGQSFLQGVDHASRESPDPIRSEFALLLQETNLGLPVEAAFQNMVNRVPSKDLEITATAYLIQKNVGGNLADVMEKVAATIRERVKLEGQIRVLTAQGMLSGVLVGALPFVLGVVLYGMNPDYVSMLWTTEIGRYMLAGAVVLQILGALAIKKIVTIDI